jgi:hypothetical protein
MYPSCCSEQVLAAIMDYMVALPWSGLVQHVGWRFLSGCLATDMVWQYDQPDIFNSDQSLQFIAHAFINGWAVTGFRIALKVCRSAP